MRCGCFCFITCIVAGGVEGVAATSPTSCRLPSFARLPVAWRCDLAFLQVSTCLSCYRVLIFCPSLVSSLARQPGPYIFHRSKVDGVGIFRRWWCVEEERPAL
ncbi:hypothetical protein C8Q76DRAFT_760244 [Earliella scabrosa]|nr:hypothetical protein C8Q76DRAFT_760244 [Earliella scabrosa]